MSHSRVMKPSFWHSPLSLFLACLLILELIPREALAKDSGWVEENARSIEVPEGYLISQDKEKAKDKLQATFDGFSNASSKPSQTHSHPSKAKSLDGKHVAQITQKESLRRACLGAVRITGGNCDVKVDAPRIQEDPPGTYPSSPSSNSYGNSNSALANADPRVKAGAALVILGLLGALMGVAFIAAGPAILASAGLSLGIAYATIGASAGVVALGALVAWGDKILPPVGYVLAGSFVAIGGFLSGILKNLLLGLPDFKIDSDSIWADIFNASQDI
ncbi:MAG: hypothetical protein AAB091_06490, partial [Elusimicrobiota bacterium]